MALRWRSSATNETGRAFGFEGGIEGQNTTARHEEGCAETVRNLVQAGGWRAASMAWLTPSVFVDFEDAERIAFGIDEIALPSGVGDGELGQGDDSPELRDGSGGCVKVFDFE
jgi:hypothetical protein